MLKIWFFFIILVQWHDQTPQKCPWLFQSQFLRKLVEIERWDMHHFIRNFFFIISDILKLMDSFANLGTFCKNWTHEWNLTCKMSKIMRKKFLIDWCISRSSIFTSFRMNPLTQNFAQLHWSITKNQPRAFDF